jgi:hypothetical protein
MNINNSDLFKELKEGARLQQLSGKIPDKLASSIVPVMEVNPKLLRRIDTLQGTMATATGTMTPFTTPNSNRDFYLSAVHFAFIKDATCDVATGRINLLATIGGVTNTIIVSLPCITLTAQSENAIIEFPTPIKIDRNTSINSPITYTAGTMVRTAMVYGYFVDNPLA